MGNTPTLTQSEEQRAPWNEKPNPVMDFDICCTVVLEKTVSVKTDECVTLPDGFLDTSFVNCETAYLKEHISICEMLNKLENYVKQDLALTGLNTDKGRYLQKLLRECQGWILNSMNCEPV